MGTLIGNRIVKQLESEAERLETKEENEINPTGKVVDAAGSEYLYSLASLDAALHYIYSFVEDLDKRNGENKNRFLFELDKRRSETLPAQIAVCLRGYIGGISEDSMVLEGKKLEELQSLLYNWSLVNMVDGKEQDEIYQFFYTYENQRIELLSTDNADFLLNLQKKWKDIDEYVKDSTVCKLRLFREALIVLAMVVSDAFYNIWAGYEDILAVQSMREISQQEYIDKTIDEKLELIKDATLNEFLKIEGDLKNTVEKQVTTEIASIKEAVEGIDVYLQKIRSYIYENINKRIKRLEYKISESAADKIRKVLKALMNT